MTIFKLDHTSSCFLNWSQKWDDVVHLLFKTFFISRDRSFLRSVLSRISLDFFSAGAKMCSCSQIKIRRQMRLKGEQF